jgi:SAM-dependent methyltransferase
MLTSFYVLTASLNQPYWYNPIIHNLGNTGFLGNIHAMSTPYITKFIDKKAYSGIDVREKVYEYTTGTICDLCCGTGFSTKPGSTGVDTSKEMLRFANFYNPGSRYLFGNAETYGKDREFDIVTCMFAFHEIPEEGHRKILNNALRISKNKVIIVDISTEYKPSNLMLAGEPYTLDYLKNIDILLESYSFEKTNLIKGHVDIWEYDKGKLVKRY